MKSLEFFAGEKAFARVLREGLRAEDVEVVAGAAGGPKWLGLSQLDRAVFGTWLRRRERPLHLIGSSIGAWRFAAVSSGEDLTSVIARFEEAYLAQRYRDKPSVEEVSTESRRIFDSFLDAEGIRRILQHPSHRLHVVTARCRGVAALDAKPALASALGVAVFLNCIHPKLLHTVFERNIFSDERASVPLSRAHRFNPIALTPENLRSAILASGSIPLVMQGERGIQGASGVHRDGGILDYHMDVPFEIGSEKLVLFPHFGERVIPGWFDKALKHRKPKRHHFENVLMVCPSKEFLVSLPHGKIPDRKDFQRFQGRDDERVRYWRIVLSECARLHDDFLSVVEGDKIGSRLKPMPFC